jgi:drug/metabolite transporter (DMT)-like permease
MESSLPKRYRPKQKPDRPCRDVKFYIPTGAIGIILLLLAEFCFSSSTVFAKLANNLTPVNPHLFVFLRFVIGVVLAAGYLLYTKESFLPQRWDLVIARGVFNTISVSLFYVAITRTSVTNANMLNMTYPVFVFLLAPLVVKEKANSWGWLFLAVTLLGALLVINPRFQSINSGDVYGLMSGMVSGAAIVTLRLARKYESSTIILFYLMLIGTVMTAGLVLPHFNIPAGLPGWYVWAAAVTGVVGQAFITIGYRYIAATSGSLVSASRIIFATILGVSFCGDHLSLQIVLGGTLILWSLVSLSIFGLRHRIQTK